ncbi:Abi family protein [Corynebacterium pseudotuberculosis]|uniref:Abi family protein n=1 Tax=Corynebacterium pseudotuberculosis TaxID=1719 RepID=UPI000640666A|nr:Abi family protein [Corynebacterium pseudotuberculosis]AKJ56671.1 Abi family protein [Corynebacterium pseudotuberculosis]
MADLKPSTTLAEQVDLLRSRGMIVDEALACQWLSNVSYYRMSAYWYPARRFDVTGARADDFIVGTSFADAAALYEADRKLRALTHDGMERIEVALRTRIGNLLCETDPLAYTDPATFRSNFQHSQWISLAGKRIGRVGRSNEAVKHYQSKYAASFPFWVLAEVLDFADISKLFEGLPSRSQQEIAGGLNFVVDLSRLSATQRGKVKKQHPLVRWLEQLTVVRNMCAHHARLWNKSFTPAPTAALRTQPELVTLPEGQSERLFGVLTVMAHTLRTTSPATTWPEKIATLIHESFLTNPLVESTALGLPDDWNGTF